MPCSLAKDDSLLIVYLLFSVVSLYYQELKGNAFGGNPEVFPVLHLKSEAPLRETFRAATFLREYRYGRKNRKKNKKRESLSMLD
jgi:hypothetical protein